MTNAFLDMGAEYSGMEKLGTELNIDIMSSTTFTKYVNLAHEKNKEIREAILSQSRAIVRKAYIDLNPDLANEEIIDIAVSYDGSWHTRGFKSLHGIGIVIDILTGLVVDFVVLSKYCEVCAKQKAKFKNKADYNIWKEEHKKNGECEQNFDGSSGAMEVIAAEILWTNSIQNCKMRYVIFLGDGDVKAHAHLQTLNIYEGVEIEKQECVNHVGKRIYAGLKTLCKSLSEQKQSIGGAKFGSLTDVKMKKLQSYYGRAIRKHAPDVKAMKTAIFATIYHASSTDQKPRHGNCPKGVDSWCFWQRSKATKEKPTKKHKEMSLHLRPDVVNKILPVYKRLSSDDLLQRCVTLGTQNANESVHHSIWSKCLKSRSTSLKKVQIAVTNGVGEFNMGYEMMLKIKQSVRGLNTPQKSSLAIAMKRDVKRCKSSVARSKDTSRYARKEQKRAKSAAEQRKRTKEGVTYGAGTAQ